MNILCEAGNAQCVMVYRLLGGFLILVGFTILGLIKYLRSGRAEDAAVKTDALTLGYVIAGFFLLMALGLWGLS